MRRGAGAAALVLLTLAPPAPLFARDWPGLALPAGAEQTADVDDGAGLWTLATAPDATLTLPGTRRRGAWRLPADAGTALGVVSALQARLEAAGWQTRLICADTACGGFDFRHGRDVLPLPAMYVDLSQFLYLSATRDGAGLEAIASASAQGLHLQLAETLPAGPADAPPEAGTDPAPEPPATAAGPALAWTPERLGDALARAGAVVIEGLDFDTGTTAVDAAGAPVLAALAAWLGADPARRVALVGHSDWRGALEPNRRLAAARAEAVARLLVEEMQVAAGQIEVHGAGWLAPRTGNAEPRGRAANRRVEIVLLPPAG